MPLSFMYQITSRHQLFYKDIFVIHGSSLKQQYDFVKQNRGDVLFISFGSGNIDTAVTYRYNKNTIKSKWPGDDQHHHVLFLIFI